MMLEFIIIVLAVGFLILAYFFRTKDRISYRGDPVRRRGKTVECETTSSRAHSSLPRDYHVIPADHEEEDEEELNTNVRVQLRDGVENFTETEGCEGYTARSSSPAGQPSSSDSFSSDDASRRRNPDIDDHPNDVHQLTIEELEKERDYHLRKLRDICYQECINHITGSLHTSNGCAIERPD